MRTSALPRCAPEPARIRWHCCVLRRGGQAGRHRAGGTGRDGSDPPVRGPGTGSGPGVLTHPCSHPLRVASAPAIRPGRVSSAAPRRRRIRWPTGWPSGCSASPRKTGTRPVTARRGRRAGLLDGSDPAAPGRMGLSGPSSPAPIEACRDEGSLPSTSKERAPASALRRPWRNRKSAGDMDGRGRVRSNGDFVSGDSQSEPDTQESPPPPASGGQNQAPRKAARPPHREAVDHCFRGRGRERVRALDELPEGSCSRPSTLSTTAADARSRRSSG